MDLDEQVVEPFEVRVRVGEFAQRTLLAFAVFEDAGRLLDERAVPGRIGPENLVEPSLADDHVHLLAKTGIGEQFLDIEQTTWRAVDCVFGAAVAEDRARDRDFRIVDVERVVGVVDGEAHLCAAERGAGGRAREDHILHRCAPEVAGTLLAHHPGERVDDVRLAGAVRADHGGDAGLETQRGRRGERFEAAQRQFLEIHAWKFPCTRHSSSPAEGS